MLEYKVEFDVDTLLGISNGEIKGSVEIYNAFGKLKFDFQRAERLIAKIGPEKGPECVIAVHCFDWSQKGDVCLEFDENGRGLEELNFMQIALFLESDFEDCDYFQPEKFQTCLARFKPSERDLRPRWELAVCVSYANGKPEFTNNSLRICNYDEFIPLSEKTYPLLGCEMSYKKFALRQIEQEYSLKQKKRK